MRTTHNLKATGQVMFARQTETFEPEVQCLRALPKVQHLWTRTQVLADLPQFMAAVTLTNKHTGAIPVFHVRHPEPVMGSCLHGELGARLSS